MYSIHVTDGREEHSSAERKAVDNIIKFLTWWLRMHDVKYLT